jgi:hypothetical protein
MHVFRCELTIRSADDASVLASLGSYDHADFVVVLLEASAHEATAEVYVRRGSARAADLGNRLDATRHSNELAQLTADGIVRTLAYERELASGPIALVYNLGTLQFSTEFDCEDADKDSVTILFGEYVIAFASTLGHEVESVSLG